jgi:hypothetical protein
MSKAPIFDDFEFLGLETTLSNVFAAQIPGFLKS